MTPKKNLRYSGSFVYIYDDITLLPAKIAKNLREQSNINAVGILNERIVL